MCGARMHWKRGGGSGTQNFVDQKWPDNIFRTVNFVFSHDGHFGRGRGGSRGGGGPLPMVVIPIHPWRVCVGGGGVPQRLVGGRVL